MTDGRSADWDWTAIVLVFLVIVPFAIAWLAGEILIRAGKAIHWIAGDR